jgi:EamA domain-containing membrane protein RarD
VENSKTDESQRDYMIKKTILFGVIAITILLDLKYKFGNFDTPFFLVFGIYLLATWVMKLTHRCTFIIDMILLLLMGVFYIYTGPVRLTERAGEWWFLFFVCGLVQYGWESFHEQQN